MVYDTSNSDGPGVGHNSSTPGDNGQLIALLDRIERLEADKQEVAADIKEVYGEAKAVGYNVKILRKLIGIRKQDADKRAEDDAILELYAQATGTPL